MYYVYMLWCRDDTLYTGTASDLCRRMRQHRDGGAACARYTRSHPPRELAGVWRTEGRREALRLEYAVKRLSRQGKLTLLHRPKTAAAGRMRTKQNRPRHRAARSGTANVCTHAHLKKPQ